MVMTTGGLRPRGMNAFTAQVFDALEQFIVSPWNLLKIECGWRGLDPLNLDDRVLETLLPKVRAHVARLTDDENAGELESALRVTIANARPH